jgi:hypothetical protein
MCYFMELVVGESKCKNGEGEEATVGGAQCAEERDGSVRKTYFVGSWYRNWLPDATTVKTNARSFAEIVC